MPGGRGIWWDLGLGLGLKLKLAWEQAHLCQLGVGKPPAYLTHSSWRLVLPAPLPKLPLMQAISKLV